MKNTKIDKNLCINYIVATLLVVIFGVFTFSHSVEADEINIENVVQLANQDRIKNGISELLISSKLNNVATKKAQDMIQNNYFSHNSPTGINPWHWFSVVGYDYKYAGENLAINYSTAEEQQAAWMSSPTHRKNILNAKYEEIGVATTSGYINNKPAFITVQVFGAPQKISTGKISRNNNTIMLNSYVLGKQNNPPLQTLYLKQANTYANEEVTNIFSGTKNTHILLTIKKQAHNLLWVTILMLCIIIIRHLVLKNISSSLPHHHPSITNLVLVIMLLSAVTNI